MNFVKMPKSANEAETKKLKDNSKVRKILLYILKIYGYKIFIKKKFVTAHTKPNG